MPDSWTIIAADANTLTLQMTIQDSLYTWIVGSLDIDMSNEIDLLTAVRDFATEQRALILAAQTPPIVVANLVGHSEEF